MRKFRVFLYSLGICLNIQVVILIRPFKRASQAREAALSMTVIEAFHSQVQGKLFFLKIHHGSFSFTRIAQCSVQYITAILLEKGGK